MRILLVSTTALALCAAGPAFAQTQQSPGNSSQNTARTAKAVEDGLNQAGIQDIKMVDAAYLVSAKTKDGQRVTIFIDPPNAPSASGTSGSSGTASSSPSGSAASGQASSQKQVRDMLQKAGFTDVNVLDAAYLMRGKTKAGDQVTMMVDPTMTTGSTATGMSSSANSGSPAGHPGAAAGTGGSATSGAANPGQPVKK